jgi:glyoxylase-like metal-dependent hydrolase (beta-lactamase superfamily II)
MAEVKVLIEGYAREIKDGWVASSTVSLVKSKGKNIIVDPGCNKTKLLASLRKEKLKTKDIDYVLLTHGHTDHTLLAGIFENAKIINPVEIYEGDKQTENKNIIPETELKIIQTPGHTVEHCSLIVPKKQEMIIVAGDVFWWTDNEEQKIDIQKKDDAHSLETDMEKLIESRKILLEIADYIIPGHGKMFKVKR